MHVSMRSPGTISVLFLLFGCQGSSDDDPVQATDGYEVSEIQTLVTNGVRPQWSLDGDWILFDRRDTPTSNYQLWRIRPDGSDMECLTCGRAELPGHNGAGNVDPTGRYVVFLAEKSSHDPIPPGSTITDPGGGIYSDVTILDLNTSSVTRLTDVSDMGASAGGSLNPRFSNDGTKLIWGDFQDAGGSEAELGNWRMAIADFVPMSPPAIANTTYYDPGPRPEYIVTSGFDANHESAYLSMTPLPGQEDHAADPVRYHFATGESERLVYTSGLNGEPYGYEEHGRVAPDGLVYAYMSSTGHGIGSGFLLTWLKAELWVVGVDALGPKQLTFFNSPSHPHAPDDDSRVVVSKLDWNPEGSKIVFSAWYVHSENTLADDELLVQIATVRGD